jgi:tetratricopeptide (TPR) repeat protein
MFAHHTSGDIFLSLARIEKNWSERKRLLEKALMHQNEAVGIIGQFMPFYYWKRGKMLTFVADVKAELADLAKDSELRKTILQEAVLDKDNSLKLVIRYAEFWEGKGSIPALFANLGNWQYGYGDMLSRLYEVAGSREHLRKAMAVFEEAAQTFEKLNLISRMAECYWKRAQTCDRLGEHLSAANNFSMASDNYVKCAEKLPQLKDFYQEHASYMQAWSEIEKARHHHRRREYGVAMEHFQKAADMHKSLKRWGYLASNYSAWAQLERAEELSRKGRSEEALAAFERTAKLFQETKNSLETIFGRTEDSHENRMVANMIKATDLRTEYCRARITLEEARILDKKGDHTTSAKKYADAQEMLQKIAVSETEQNRRELQTLIFLCQAWEKMMMAEAKASSTMYGEAARLFEQAKEHMLDEQTSLLALANSSFCKALVSGTEFESTRNQKLYSKSKKHMEAAANYYLKAGFVNDAEYVRATQRLFDAYMYLNRAQTETKPKKKAQYYQLAEKLLQASAITYTKAKHLGKGEEVKRLLESVREEKQLVISLAAALHPPTISSMTASFSAPTSSYEKAVGLERFEHTDIQAHLSAFEEAIIGEEFEVRLDLVNVARNFGLLISVDNMAPQGFKVTNVHPEYRLENDSINLKGKRLDALKVETIKILVEATEAGVAYLCPEVVYTDDAGNFKTCRPEALRVTVHAPLSFKFTTDAARMVFDCLVHAFVEDYMKRRLFIDEAGWRSLVQIVKNAGVSFRSVYGNERRRGSAISELERRGFIELRIFLGQRGRGGKITKARIFYGKETIKRYIDAKVAHN